MLLAPPTSEHPLLVMHGFAGQPHAWDGVVGTLDADVVRVRLPGHGPRPETIGASFEDVVDALAGELPVGATCDVAAYSMGARVALGLMVRHPERVGRAMLIGVGPGVDEAERSARQAWDEDWARRIEAEGLEAFEEAWAALPFFATQRRLPSPLLDAQRSDRRGHTASGLAWAMRHLGTGHMPSYRSALDAVRAEVTLVVGELDEKYVAIASRMTTRLPHATLVEVPGVGHNVLLEAPGACGDLLEAMLRR